MVPKLALVADDLAFLFSDPGRKPDPGARRTAASPRPRSAPRAANRLPAEIEWMTLREAHEQTSIPIATLRKWAKKGKVRARLERSAGTELRLVAYGDVVDRARALDRTIAPAEVIVDLRETGAASTAEPHPEPEPHREPDGPDARSTDGSILVPLDAWDNMLAQLGNLHEAGQQLAEARERAARAETEAEFLKERVREMRKRVEEAELALELHSEDRNLPQASPQPEPVLRIGWRRFRDRWLGT